MNYSVKYFNSKDVSKFYDEIVKMYEDCVYTYHYPDKKIDRHYIKTSINSLIEHLSNDLTKFIVIQNEEQIIGFTWIYKRPFLGTNRMIINAIYIIDVYRGNGLGKLLMDEIEKVSYEMNCNSISTHYSINNEKAKMVYLNFDYKVTRVEVTKIISLGVNDEK